MRRFFLVLVLLAAGSLVLASCSESDDVGVPTEEEDDSSGDDSSGDDDSDAVDDAVQLLEDQGLSPELAECAVDALIDQGIDPSELDGIAFPDEEMSTALALAGGECTEFADGLPSGALDLDDPAVRNGFITSFSASSGLSEDVAECVLDFLIDAGIDGERIIGGMSGGALDAELQQVVEDGVGACA